MAALIKAPVLKEGTIDLLPARAAGVKPAPPKAAVPQPPAKEPASTVVEGVIPPAPTVEAAPQPKPAPVAKAAADGAADARREALFMEQLKANEVLSAQAREQAAAEGYAVGVAEGREAGARDYAEAIGAWRGLLESGRDGVSSLLRESEDLIAAIVFESVCKVVGRTLVAPEACAGVVAEVISRISRDEIVAVRVSPADYAAMHAVAPDGADRSSAIPGVSVEPDERIELGGCIVDLKGGSIDGRIETQFRTFAQSLKDAARRK
ncbi:MAG: hypothetical protein HYU78_13975 [Rhodocyclales bacterium]|nr:hypothetical protein [Rhodocyclales bacterium]